jgi:hypothetical protein
VPHPVSSCRRVSAARLSPSQTALRGLRGRCLNRIRARRLCRFDDGLCDGGPDGGHARGEAIDAGAWIQGREVCCGGRVAVRGMVDGGAVGWNVPGAGEEDDCWF